MPTAKANAEQMLDTLRSLGVTKFIPMTIPVSQTNVSALGVESFVYFDEMTPRRQDDGHAHGRRSPTARLMPAVEYLQSAAAAHDDDDGARRGDDGRRRVSRRVATRAAAAAGAVEAAIRRILRRPARTVTARGARLATRGAAGAAGAGAGGAADAAGRGGRGGGRRWSGAAAGSRAAAFDDGQSRVLSGDQRARTASRAAGTPTNVTFFARPFGEMELLALAKAYQDKAGHHLKKPTKLDA